MQQWISIKENMPPKNVNVLIYEQGVMTVSHWDGTYYKDNGKNWPNFPDGQDEQPGFYWPSHWMPLPEIPFDN